MNEADFAVPCIVIIDFNLPDMTGLEALDALRRRGTEIAAILTTSTATPALRRRAAASKARVIEKPFLGDDLLDAVRAASMP